MSAFSWFAVLHIIHFFSRLLKLLNGQWWLLALLWWCCWDLCYWWIVQVQIQILIQIQMHIILILSTEPLMYILQHRQPTHQDPPLLMQWAFKLLALFVTFLHLTMTHLEKLGGGGQNSSCSIITSENLYESGWCALAIKNTPPPLDAKDKMVGQLAILYFSWVWQYGVMRFDNKWFLNGSF